MPDITSDVFFRVATPFGPGCVVSFYRELDYFLGQWIEKESPDYTYIVAMDSGGEMVLAGSVCKLEG